VTIRFNGKRPPADVHVLTDERGVVEACAILARNSRSFAKFNKFGFDEAGNPDLPDLRHAWAAGARATRTDLT
jgi:hypothetical protein